MSKRIVNIDHFKRGAHMKIFSLILLSLSFSVFSLVGIQKGDKSPLMELTSIDGKKISLAEKETVLIFYRGSWCPYCMTQLKSVQSEILPNLKKDQQLVVISVDNMVTSKKMVGKFKYSFPVVSDAKALILKKFSIINKLSDELVGKYKNSYQIDVEKDSGEKHHMVAHPAVYIVGKNGKITFADVHTDYKQRTDNKKILKNLRIL